MRRVVSKIVFVQDYGLNLRYRCVILHEYMAQKLGFGFCKRKELELERALDSKSFYVYTCDHPKWYLGRWVLHRSDIRRCSIAALVAYIARVVHYPDANALACILVYLRIEYTRV